MSMPWWHQGVIYQIYPRSFQDTDGDGITDGFELQHALDPLDPADANQNSGYLGPDGTHYRL